MSKIGYILIILLLIWILIDVVFTWTFNFYNSIFFIASIGLLVISIVIILIGFEDEELTGIFSCLAFNINSIPISINLFQIFSDRTNLAYMAFNFFIIPLTISFISLFIIGMAQISGGLDIDGDDLARGFIISLPLYYLIFGVVLLIFWAFNIQVEISLWFSGLIYFSSFIGLIIAGEGTTSI